MIYSTSSHSASSTLKLGVDLVPIHCPFGTGGRAMHVAFGRVRRKIADYEPILKFKMDRTIAVHHS